MFSAVLVLQRKPSNGVEPAPCVKMPPDHEPVGVPGPRWLTLTPFNQMACSPLDADTGLFNLIMCSTHAHWLRGAWIAGLFSSRLPQYVPPPSACML